MTQPSRNLAAWAALWMLPALCPLAVADEAWHPAPGPLMTRWAKDVSPAHALPEYPRPQMVRSAWANLNGLWDYAIVGKDDAHPADYQGKILVPFPVESALSGVMKACDPKSRLWYRRTFDVPANWSGQRVLLHFGAVDFEARVWVNGKELGSHKGGYDAFTFDATDVLKAAGPQELIVSVWDPSQTGHQPHGKQNLLAIAKPGGIFYTPSTGIWQTVWLEPVPAAASIAGVVLTPDIDRGVVKVLVAARGTREGERAGAAVLDDGKVIAEVTGKVGAEFEVPIKDAKLWSPDAPFLYSIRIGLPDRDAGGDVVESYFGMRKTSVGKDASGVTRLLLNNKFVFQCGPLDQGFWPDGIYTAPTDEALRYDIEVTKRLGFNMARKHVKVEPERWYYWADKLGLLVWQDMPGAGAGNGKTDQRTNDADAAEFEQELQAMIDGRRNHPSVVMWVVFNEGWGQYDTPRLTAWVKQHDPSRIVSNASGWTDRKVGDVVDMHKYPGPGAPAAEEARAAVLGEFGGLGLPIDGHTWTQKSWGYQGMASQAALTKRYVGLMRKVYQLKDDSGLSACVYTQTTDCETECNGLLTYDRAVIKVDADVAAKANRGEFPPPPKVVEVVPTSQKEPATWRYTTDAPAAAEWFKPDFDASAWKQGPAGFGTAGTPGSVVRTVWKTDDIWIRREVTVPDGPFAAPALMIHHDEDADVYINGILATKLKGFISEYELADMTPEAAAALKPGKNVLAVHCHQTKGGQYIDVGIVDVRP